jgi:hypothetical protein
MLLNAARKTGRYRAHPHHGAAISVNTARGIFVFEISDVLLAAVLILLNGFLSSVGQDLWLWLRDRIRRQQRE